MRRRQFASGALLGVASIAVCLGIYLAWPTLLSLLDPVDHPRIPRDALQGSAAGSATILCSANLADRIPALPSPTVLTVLDVARTDGARERRVFLTRPDRSTTYFGPLQRQLGAAPVATLFLDFGSARVIVGYVDPAELYYSGGDLISASKREDGLGGCGRDDLWGSHAGFSGFVSVLRYDLSDFNQIASIELGSPTVRKVNTRFDPPLDISGLWRRVP